MKKIICSALILFVCGFSSYIITYCVAMVIIYDLFRYPELLITGHVLAIMIIFYFVTDAVKVVWKGGQE